MKQVTVDYAKARSFLFVPATRPERFDKALASGADCVILDLEDAVDPADKTLAREHVVRFASYNSQVLVRINAAGTEWYDDDLTALQCAGIIALVVSKVASATELENIQTRTGDATALFPLIETAAGMSNLREISAVRGVSRLMFGSIDFCLDMGMNEIGAELQPYRAMIALASRVAGLPGPVDGVSIDITDDEGLRRSVDLAKATGFSAKLCIHPSQVAAVNAGFSPSASEIAFAQEVIVASAIQIGAFRLNGRMIDEPIIRWAHQLLSQ